MQKGLIDFNAPKPEQDHVFIRIGLNYGAGIVRTNDVFGDVVNVASRVESVAVPEQIVISESLREQVEKLNRFKVQHIGRFSLKGKEGDHNLYEVVWTDKKKVVKPAAHAVVAKASKVVPRYKLQHIKKDGTRLWVNGVMTLLKDESGNPRALAKLKKEQRHLRLSRLREVSQ